MLGVPFHGSLAFNTIPLQAMDKPCIERLLSRIGHKSRPISLI